MTNEREIIEEMNSVADYVDVIQPLQDRFGVPRNIIRTWANKLAASVAKNDVAEEVDGK
jgi:hypothetical protein